MCSGAIVFCSVALLSKRHHLRNAYNRVLCERTGRPPNFPVLEMDLVILLKSATAPLMELTEFFTTEGVQRAERARKVLEKKGPGCGAFYSELLIDLTDLEATLDTLGSSIVLASDDAQVVREFLRVIEEKFMNSSDGEQEAYEHLYHVGCGEASFESTVR